jgi:hypothetical protein
VEPSPRPRREGQRQRGDGVPKIGAGVGDSFVARQRVRAAARFGVDLNTFEGASAVEVHEHYNAVGIKTGETIVTRESLWDDSARGRALALIAHEDSLCKCGCGLPVVDGHKKQLFKVHEVRCWAGRAIKVHEAAVRADAEREAKQAKQDLDPTWNAGTYYYATVHDPSET